MVVAAFSLCPHSCVLPSSYKVASPAESGSLSDLWSGHSCQDPSPGRARSEVLGSRPPHRRVLGEGTQCSPGHLCSSTRPPYSGRRSLSITVSQKPRACAFRDRWTDPVPKSHCFGPKLHLNGFFFFLVFLGPSPQHMEVPRLGVKSELQLPPTPQLTATPDP